MVEGSPRGTACGNINCFLISRKKMREQKRGWQFCQVSGPRQKDAHYLALLCLLLPLDLQWETSLGLWLKAAFLKKKKRQASKQASSISQAFVTSAPSAKKMLSGFPVCILNYKHSLSFSNNKTLIITFIRHFFQTIHTLIDSDKSLPAPLKIDNIKKHKSLEKWYK